MDRFTYFLVRVRQPLGREAGRLAGLVERLATGEKHSFGAARNCSAVSPTGPTPI
jgi:hypothetical protein